MTARSAPLLFSVSQAARTAVQWWLAELAGMVPLGLRNLLSGRQSWLVADLIGEDLILSELKPNARKRKGAAATSAGSIALFRPRQLRALRLPAAEAVFRRLTLPLLPAAKLRPLLAHEIERQTPFLPAQVLFDYRILRHDKENRRIELELAVIPRETVDRALEKARQRGFTPSVLGLLGNPADPPLLNFLTAPEVGSAVRSHRPLLVLSAAAVVLTALLILGAALRHNAAQHRIEAEIAEVKQSAGVAQHLEGELAALRDRSQFLANRQQAPRLIEILDAVTRLLPPDTWIFEFQVNGREGHVTGYSPGASKLIGVFAGSELFANPHFRAPLTQAQNGQGERFDLGFEIRESAR